MKKLLSTLALTVLMPQVAQAIPIDSTYTFENEKVINFSEFNSITKPLWGVSDFQIGNPNGDDITISTSHSYIFIGNIGRTTLGDNGVWDYRRDGYVSVGGGGYHVYITFTFAKPLNAVGGFINYDGTYRRPHIAILNANGFERDRYTIDHNFFTCRPNYNLGKFYGIAREQNDIYGFKILAGPTVLDNLTYSYVPDPVPEPSTLLLFSTGLVGLTLHRRKPTK